jgi:hypothetical protein
LKSRRTPSDPNFSTGHDPKSLSAFVERSDLLTPEELLKMSKLQGPAFQRRASIKSRDLASR